MNYLDTARVLLSLTMLGYASWHDLRTREIYDLVWIVFGALGLITAIYEVYTGSLSLIGFVVPVLFSTALSIVLGYVGLFGGADIEAFIALAILNPSQPRQIVPYLGVVSVIYPLSLFSNSALSGASFALFILARNIALALSGKHLFGSHTSESAWKKLVVMFSGRKIRLESVRGPPFQYPLELPPEEEGDNRKLVLLPDIRDDEAAEEVFRRLGGEGVEEVWVSHTLPFLVFITIGYVLTLLFGDIALPVLSWLLFQ